MPFLSKVLEKIVFLQLSACLTDHNLLENFQSRFRVRHSTETGNPSILILRDLFYFILFIYTNLLIFLSKQSNTDKYTKIKYMHKRPKYRHRISIQKIILLDLTTAFNTIHHSIILDQVGISGIALFWFSSYLSNRYVKVRIGNHSSPSALLS